MNIEKTSAIVLSVMPYRESSAILQLFTRNHGMVGGIAKGIRRNSARAVPVERGFLIETLLYIRHGRDLHTLGDIQLTDGYLEIRGDLERSAFRDVAFELVLRSIKATDPHPELFDFIVAFVEGLGSTACRNARFAALWRFYYGFASFLGFGFDCEHCAGCGSPLPQAQGNAWLLIDRGTVACARCAQKYTMAALLPTAVLCLLRGGEAAVPELGDREMFRITRLLSSYCRYHLEITGELRALDFVEQVLPAGSR